METRPVNERFAIQIVSEEREIGESIHPLPDEISEGEALRVALKYSIPRGGFVRLVRLVPVWSSPDLVAETAE
jgi:hypothetical protein